jgi:hypothetical protein
VKEMGWVMGDDVVSKVKEGKKKKKKKEVERRKRGEGGEEVVESTRNETRGDNG